MPPLERRRSSTQPYTDSPEYGPVVVNPESFRLPISTASRNKNEAIIASLLDDSDDGSSTNLSLKKYQGHVQDLLSKSSSISSIAPNVGPYRASTFMAAATAAKTERDNCNALDLMEFFTQLCVGPQHHQPGVPQQHQPGVIMPETQRCRETQKNPPTESILTKPQPRKPAVLNSTGVLQLQPTQVLYPVARYPNEIRSMRQVKIQQRRKTLVLASHLAFRPVVVNEEAAVVATRAE